MLRTGHCMRLVAQKEIPVLSLTVLVLTLVKCIQNCVPWFGSEIVIEITGLSLKFILGQTRTVKTQVQHYIQL